MPYKSNADLPAGVRNALPESAQAIWRNAANSAFSDHATEERAAKIAWGAVKNAGWKKGEDGTWRLEKAAMLILKSYEPKRYTLGIVYEPFVVDAHADWTTDEEIEKACWGFNRRLYIQGKGADLIKALVKASEGTPMKVSVNCAMLTKGSLGVQHTNWDDENGEIVESYLAPADFRVGDQDVRKGTWLMGIVWSPENWTKVQNGELTGLSLGGRAVRERG